jgi:hypothetical protein
MDSVVIVVVVVVVVVDNVFLLSVRRLLDTVKVSSSPVLVTLMIEVLSSSETSVLRRATRVTS